MDWRQVETLSPGVLQRGGHGSTELRLSPSALLGQREAQQQLAGPLLGWVWAQYRIFQKSYSPG